MRGAKLTVLIFSLFLVVGLVSAVAPNPGHSFDEISLPSCAQGVSVGVLLKQDGEWKCLDAEYIASIIGGGSGGGESYWVQENGNDLKYNADLSGEEFPRVRIGSGEDYGTAILQIGGDNTPNTIGIKAKGTYKGVYGKNTDNGNYGVLGNSNAGVYGSATDDDNAVYGIKSEGEGEAIYGLYSGKTRGYLGGEKIAIYGKNLEDNSEGALGSKIGGVIGSAGDTPYAGFFEGDVRITGDLDVANNLGVEGIMNLYQAEALKLPKPGEGDCNENNRGRLAYNYNSDTLIVCTEDSGSYRWKAVLTAD